MNTTDAPTQAIPTVYNGVQLRSRMEAQCALLFDTLGWKWEYEPFSVMLPNGVAYRPDFWLPEYKIFVECRGYDSDKGNAQIFAFRELLISREYESAKYFGCRGFMMIGPGEDAWMASILNGPLVCHGTLGWCFKCVQWTPSCSHMDFCHKCTGNIAFRLWLGTIRGKVIVHDEESDSWSSQDFWTSHFRRLRKIWTNARYSEAGLTD